MPTINQTSAKTAKKNIIGKGRYLTLVQENGWEYAQRNQVSGIVAIIAVTRDKKVVLTEQYRPPVKKRVIELPAGLAGDTREFDGETLETAARRELLEETGYEARGMKSLCGGPISAGFGTEVLTFFKATGLKIVTEGGGDDSEDITVHEVPLRTVKSWLLKQESETVCIDPKIFTGLYFVK
jgi:ADP-ribose pyrophosphatase